MIETICLDEDSWREAAIDATSHWHEAMRERDEARGFARDAFELLAAVVQWDEANREQLQVRGNSIHHEFLNELEDAMSRALDLGWVLR